MGDRWKYNPFRIRSSPILFVFCFVSGNLDSSSSLSEQGLTLLRFRDRVVKDPYGALVNWNPRNDPCSWNGIECSSSGLVVTLNLKDLCLEGTLAPELGDLIHAKSIVLRNNSFSGSIPKEVKALKDLEVLDLGYNNFSGPLPLDPSSNPSSTILLLDNNKLLCSTSPEVHELLKLSEIQVDEKHHSSHFHGESGKGRPISRNIVQAGNVPYRRLLKLEDLPKSSASVPTSSPEPSPLNFLPSSPSSSSPSRSSAASVSPPAFHTPSEHPVVSAKPPGPLSSPSASPFEWNHSALLIISGALGVAGIITILFVVFLLRSNNAVIVKPWVTGLSGQLQKAFVTGVPKLKRSELETACEEFSNIISSSAVDTVYKGTLSTGVEIAVTSTIVTSAKNWSKDLEEAFRKKIDTLSKVNHKNFVNLLGFCEEEEPFTRMMVFEYAPNGTLFEHLHIKETEHLDWKARLRIAMGIAYSLEHMHQLTPPIFHKKLHTSTIYLTEDYASKISDFGFWNEIETPSINPESNIHDFGVILLEMITGKLSNSLDPKSLMADPTLKCFEEKEFERLCEVIKACVCSYPNQRPTMREVTTWMREITLITPEAARPRASPLWWAELEIASSTTEEVS